MANNPSNCEADNSDVSKEQKLLNYILSLPKDELDSIRGNPQKVIDTIDDYALKNHFMMIGPYKGKFIVDMIREVKPREMVELGCYFGYSAIMFAKELSEPNAKYYSFEVNPEFALIANRIIELAGLSSKVEIIVGKAAKSLVDFESKLRHEKNSHASIDFIFIDHWKDLYLPDFRVLESLNLIAPGTIIAADNVIVPGAPEYVKYVKGSPEDRREYNYNFENINGKEFPGRWNILYESETHVAVDPNGHRDGVEITRCVEYLNG